MGVSRSSTFFCDPLYKFSKLDFLCWLDEIERYVKREDFKIYVENVFNENLTKPHFARYTLLKRFVWK